MSDLWPPWVYLGMALVAAVGCLWLLQPNRSLPDNQRRLLLAFPEYWKQYDELAHLMSDPKTRTPRAGEPMKFRKKPVVIEATQWFKNGDHPDDGDERFPPKAPSAQPMDRGLDDRSLLRDLLCACQAKKTRGRLSASVRQPSFRRTRFVFLGRKPGRYTGEFAGELYEGKVVRYYRHPAVDGERPCEHCAVRMHEHGWIDTKEGGHIVCPGDWVITGIQGERYPCKPDIFAATYEPVEGTSQLTTEGRTEVRQVIETLQRAQNELCHTPSDVAHHYVKEALRLLSALKAEAPPQQLSAFSVQEFIRTWTWESGYGPDLWHGEHYTQQRPALERFAVDLLTAYTKAGAAPRSAPQQERSVERFLAWVNRTPHSFPEGSSSQIAYDAQVRVLEQLQTYLEGHDDYLTTMVHFDSTAPRSAPATKVPDADD